MTDVVLHFRIMPVCLRKGLSHSVKPKNPLRISQGSEGALDPPHSSLMTPQYAPQGCEFCYAYEIFINFDDMTNITVVIPASLSSKRNDTI